jgi:AraC-like DNA-binding protein
LNDFASAAMVRVLAEGMRQLGLRPPVGVEAPAAGDAHVAIELKRVVVTAALQQGGIGSLALLGRGLKRFRDEPTHQALVSARSAGDLLVRWSRLERYVHSRHRVVVHALEDRERMGLARLRHEARYGPAPLAAEDLVVLGVLAALLEEIGLRDVTAYVGPVQVFQRGAGPELEAAFRSGRTCDWTLSWTGAAPAPRRRACTQRRATPSAAELQFSESGWPDIACRAASHIAADLARPLPVAGLASALGMSKRGLQRTLSDADLSYSFLLAQTRRRAAAWWLLHGECSVAEAGFLAGYADQPHFTRDFRQHVGVPPAAYREAFGERSVM